MYLVCFYCKNNNKIVNTEKFKQKFSRILETILLPIIFILIAFSLEDLIITKIKADKFKKASFEYYRTTEAYLDEINKYCDVSSGSDIHCEYLDALKSMNHYFIP